MCCVLPVVRQCVNCDAYHLQPVAVMAESSSKKTHKPVAGSGPVVPQCCAECGGRFKVRAHAVVMENEGLYRRSKRARAHGAGTSDRCMARE